MNLPEYNDIVSNPIGPGAARRAVEKLRTGSDFLKFALRQRFSTIQIGDRPWLDEEAGEYFLQRLRQSNSFLEYGSGGSTVLAKSLGKPFISVETDRFLQKAVRKKIGLLAPDQHLDYANIGWTWVHGYPVFRSVNAARLRRWKAYVELPWRYAAQGHLPDLVLIDGRFRVAAALTSCVYLAGASDSRILVDDYAPRPWYHPVAEYARLLEMKGRMAVFQPPMERPPGILDAIDHFVLDCT